MIHYSCDVCHRKMEPDELRYAVRIEVWPVAEPLEEDHEEDDRDYLLELHESLEQCDCEAEAEAPAPKQRSYDLCPDCHRRWAHDPLGELAKPLEFSPN